MRAYLKQLLMRYFHIGSMQRQLSDLERWRTGEKRKALERGASFFNWATYALSRTTLVELSALLSPEADRSLIDWLGKAKMHANAIKPTRYNANCADERERISKDDYGKIIEGHLDRLKNQQDIIDLVKAHRDKAIAHFDKSYFDSPEQVHQDYPLSKKDVRGLLDSIREVIKEHYGYLFESDMDMEVHTAHTVDAVLEYTLGFIRAQEDPKLLERGFEPGKYLPDFEPTWRERPTGNELLRNTEIE